MLNEKLDLKLALVERLAYYSRRTVFTKIENLLIQMVPPLLKKKRLDRNFTTFFTFEPPQLDYVQLFTVNRYF